MTNKELAIAAAEKLREVEASANDEGATATAEKLTELHELLARCFVAASALDSSLEWPDVAGSANRVGGAHTNGGGTPKDPPQD